MSKRSIRVVAFAWLPMGLAALGAFLDERRALGFTIWRAACRASGLTPSSIATFTLELMPMAVIGALLGCLLVLLTAFGTRPSAARGAIAAHAGCVIAMPAGLLLCASASPWPLMLAAEFGLAALAAAGVWWITRIRKATYPNARARVVPRIPRIPAADENFPVNQTWNPHDCS
jgi:hypothetical protein